MKTRQSDNTGKTEKCNAGSDLQSKQKQVDQLRYSEERFRILLDNMPAVGIQGYDAKGIIHYWNRGSELIYGYSATEALGKRVVDLIIPPELKTYVQDSIEHGAETGAEMPPPNEVTLMRKNGSPVPVFCSHAVISLPGHPTEMFCIDINLTSQKETEKKLRETAEKLAESQERLRSLRVRAEHAREDEQRRIARRIHDDFGQRLTKLKINLTWLRNAARSSDDGARQRVESTLEDVQNLLTLASDISMDLRPTVLDHFGFPAALEWTAEKFADSAEILMNIDIDNQIRFSENVEASLYRITQELLTNIARHAHAEHVSISLQGNSKTVQFVVSDDGIGLPDNSSKNSMSMGILAMQETALSIGASIDIDSTEGKGTTVCVTIPQDKPSTEEEREMQRD